MNYKRLSIIVLIISMASCATQNNVSKSRYGSGQRAQWRTGSSRRTTTKKSTRKKNPVASKKRIYTIENKNTKTAKKLSTKDYINLYKEIAIKEMNYSGIPAGITLAQGILESGNGNSGLARKSNNHFGIKCHSSWDGEKVFHDDDAPQECFRKYDHPYESYRDHTDFLVNGYRYQFLFDYDINDYENWAKGLKQAGYATAPDYAEKLINIIERYELFKYTNAYVNKNVSNGLRPPVVSGLRKQSTPDSEPKSSSKSNSKKNSKRVKKEIRKLNIKTDKGRKYIIVESGDTFYNITGRTNISQADIMKFNALKSSVIIVGQKLYLEPKIAKVKKQAIFPETKTKTVTQKNKPVNPKPKVKTSSFFVYKVKQGDTLYSIARNNKVSLDNIYKINEMKKGDVIKIGQSLKIPKSE
jgi:flagellum-specific peptidoglycan hydrolase FlgJ/LysM repeat protein